MMKAFLPLDTTSASKFAAVKVTAAEFAAATNAKSSPVLNIVDCDLIKSYKQ